MKKVYLFNVALLLVGVLFASASRAQDYTRWNLPEGALARLGKGSVAWGDRAVAYSPDGTRLAVASNIGVWLYDAHTGDEVALLIKHTSFIYSVAFSPDGKTLASASEDGTVQLWEVSTGQLKDSLKGHTTFVLSVAFSPDGKTLASGGGWSDSTIQLWEVSTGQVKASLKGHTHHVHSMAFSPDSATLASASPDGTIRLWEVSTGQLKDSLEGHTVAFSPDGATLASGNDDDTIRLWDVSTGQVKASLEGHTWTVESVAFSPDGKTLASSGGWMDPTVRLWDPSTGQLKDSLEGHTDAVASVAFSQYYTTLASASQDGTIRLWDPGSGRHKTTLEGHTGWIWSMAFSPDGRTLASGGSWPNYTVRLWEIGSGQRKATLEGHTSYVHSVAFSPDGKTLASASRDGTILLWDMLNILDPPVDISVPIGFDVEKWSWLEPVAIDLITNREYGTGIIGATILNAASDDGEVLLWRYSAGREELIARIPAKLVNAVPTVRFDQTGLFDNKLFVTINAGPDGRRKTRVVIVEPNGEFRDAINIYDENSTQASIEFINQPNYPAGAYIYDADIGQGQSFYRLDESFNLHLIASHTLPADRSDIDPMDLKADPTGKYGGLLTLSDTDLNHERLSGLYQLQADGEWRTLVPPAPVSERQFQGIAFSNAGPLGSGLYVADAAANNIWIASPKGHIEAFAIGFAAPKRVAIGPEGTDMWVTDQTGLYRIFSTDPSDQEARKATLPITSGLQPNYPNPFNSSTQISYSLSTSGPVRLEIYNALGQPVRTLVDAIQTAGAYQVPWDGRDHRGARVANGVYLYRLQAGEIARVRKMLVLE